MHISSFSFHWGMWPLPAPSSLSFWSLSSLLAGSHPLWPGLQRVQGPLPRTCCSNRAKGVDCVTVFQPKLEPFTIGQPLAYLRLD